ncbi:hypothetical protein [Sphingobacterium bambusae]|uniref:Uncharacterized protein n=1 Tax=Sphingobacterium bambusae TaxID=662858 RepID=A0ABW6BKD3_9SPHI|nr:hypothetical protein [Sphingobacterium bambusae]WPL47883.1 hypothetical protein SCB77_18195 [Sphingobacterium bambusae]
MTSQHLDSLKELLNLDDASVHGQFGIYVNEDDRRDEYYYIGANKEGLRLFAYQLLCAAVDQECHEREEDASIPIIGLYPEKNPWVRKDSEIILENIQSNLPDLSDVVDKPAGKRYLDNALGLMLVGAILLTLVVGVYTIFAYLVDLLW